MQTTTEQENSIFYVGRYDDDDDSSDQSICTKQVEYVAMTKHSSNSVTRCAVLTLAGMVILFSRFPFQVFPRGLGLDSSCEVCKIWLDAKRMLIEFLPINFAESDFY